MDREEYKNIEFDNINLSAKKLFEFPKYQSWINHATFMYSETGLSKNEREKLLITLDSKGRLCRRGGDFMRARDEDCFPVSVYIMNFTI